MINVSVWQAPKWISVGSLFTLQIIFGTRSMQRNNSLKCSVSGGVRHLLEGHQSLSLWGGTKDQARKGQYIFLEGYANIWHHLWYMILAPTMMQFITLVMRKKSTTTWFFPFLLYYVLPSLILILSTGCCRKVLTSFIEKKKVDLPLLFIRLTLQLR